MNPLMKLSEERIRHVARKAAADMLARKGVETRLGEEGLARRIGAAMRNRIHIEEEADREAREAIRKRVKPLREGTPEFLAELQRLRTEIARKRL